MSNVTDIPTARDELAGSFEAIVRTLSVYARYAPEIAKARFALFTAHIEAGFSEPQALELCKGLGL